MEMPYIQLRHRFKTMRLKSFKQGPICFVRFVSSVEPWGTSGDIKRWTNTVLVLVFSWGVLTTTNTEGCLNHPLMHMVLK